MTAGLSVICLRYIYLRISKIDSLVRNSSSKLYLTLVILLVDAVAIFKCISIKENISGDNISGYCGKQIQAEQTF